MGKKNVVVTGAAGFIGYHLMKALIERGDRVVGLDNFNDYYDPSLKRARSSHLMEMGADVVEADVRDSRALESVFGSIKATHVVHLAAQAGVRYSIDNPRAYLDSNLDGFLQVLELCRNHAGTPLTYASSSSVYGLNQKVPFAETDQTDSQASLYGATKKANELMASTYHHLYQIPVTGLRFFTVYGPFGRPDMAYYSFTKAIFEGLPINVFNHGKMQRDFTYVDDIVSGIVSAIDRESKREVFNLGNSSPEELGQFIKIIEEKTGLKAQLNYLPMQPGDVEKTFADISHSQKVLGFVPQTNLDVGIGKFVDWYRNFFKRT